jgi:hypothetical protein
MCTIGGKPLVYCLPARVSDMCFHSMLLQFERLEDLKLLVKYTFYIEKLGLPGFQALQLLDKVT